jgi:osmoprotectant transport system permease protein
MEQFFSFLIKQRGRLLLLLGQHLALVACSMGVALVFALPVGYLLSKTKRASGIVIGVFSVLYSIPSLALLAVLMRISGLGFKTAVMGISIYAQFILLRNTVSAFRGIDGAVLEASKGMGLRFWEIFLKVQLPLAAPVLISGTRMATLACIGIAAIAATIHSGGLGSLLFEGIRAMYAEKIVWGSILTSLLAFLANQCLVRLERSLSLRARGEYRPAMQKGDL